VHNSNLLILFQLFLYHYVAKTFSYLTRILIFRYLIQKRDYEVIISFHIFNLFFF